MDESIVTNKDGLGVHILDLRYPLLLLAWFACNQRSVLDGVMLNQGTQSRKVPQLIRSSRTCPGCNFRESTQRLTIIPVVEIVI